MVGIIPQFQPFTQASPASHSTRVHIDAEAGWVFRYRLLCLYRVRQVQNQHCCAPPAAAHAAVPIPPPGFHDFRLCSQLLLTIACSRAEAVCSWFHATSRMAQVDSQSRLNPSSSSELSVVQSTVAGCGRRKSTSEPVTYKPVTDELSGDFLSS